MRKYWEIILFGVVLLGIVAVTARPHLQARKVSAPVVSLANRDDKRYATNLDELRTRFNQDKGKVRLLMLLSPT
jgi:hypothetical protein